MNFRYDINKQEFINLLQDYYMNQSNKLIFEEHNLDGSLLFVGDLHGDIITLNNVLEYIKLNKFDNIVFLGDYVDRYPHGILVIKKLIEFSLNYKGKVLILRGNHEDFSINHYFKENINDMFWQHSNEIIDELKKWQMSLPLCLSIINNGKKIFSVHGGIPNFNFDYIKDYERNIKYPFLTDKVRQLLWNDIELFRDRDYISLRGKGIYTIGKSTYNKFKKQYGYDYVVRGHDYNAINETHLGLFTVHTTIYDEKDKGRILIMADTPYFENVTNWDSINELIIYPL